MYRYFLHRIEIVDVKNQSWANFPIETKFIGNEN